MPSSHRLLMVCALALGAAVASGACSKKEPPARGKDAAPPGPTVAPIAMPTLGIDAIKRTNFVYEAGAPAYAKAVAAYKAKPRAWAEVRSHAEAALAKDPHHADAHRLLAAALAQAGEHPAAAEQLVAALAADPLHYAGKLADDPDLAGFLATPHGIAVKELATAITAEVGKRASAGLLVVGRRSAFKWPRNLGVEPASSRGELYAYDRDSRRYLRLTHTDHQVLAAVRATAAAEVAVLGFDKIERAKVGDGPPLFARAWLEVHDLATGARIGPRVALGGAREIAIGYAAGDQLVVATAAADGRWGAAAPVVQALDRTTGKLTKIAQPPPAQRVVVTLEDARVVRGADGVAATWTGDPPTAPALTAGGAAIAIPETGQAAQATVALAPGGARLVFATAADACAADAAPSLYVADAKAGTLKHVLTARSRFATRWLDATTLAYEDGDGGVRLWDATTGRELVRLDNKPGLALDALSLAPAPLCKQAPPAVDAVGAGSAAPDDDPPLPPEDPAP